MQHTQSLSVSGTHSQAISVTHTQWIRCVKHWTHRSQSSCNPDALQRVVTQRILLATLSDITLNVQRLADKTCYYIMRLYVKNVALKNKKTPSPVLLKFNHSVLVTFLQRLHGVGIVLAGCHQAPRSPSTIHAPGDCHFRLGSTIRMYTKEVHSQEPF